MSGNNNPRNKFPLLKEILQVSRMYRQVGNEVHQDVRLVGQIAKSLGHTKSDVQNVNTITNTDNNRYKAAEINSDSQQTNAATRNIKEHAKLDATIDGYGKTQQEQQEPLSRADKRKLEKLDKVIKDADEDGIRTKEEQGRIDHQKSKLSDGVIKQLDAQLEQEQQATAGKESTKAFLDAMERANAANAKNDVVARGAAIGDALTALESLRSSAYGPIELYQDKDTIALLQPKQNAPLTFKNPTEAMAVISAKLEQAGFGTKIGAATLQALATAAQKGTASVDTEEKDDVAEVETKKADVVKKNEVIKKEEVVKKEEVATVEVPKASGTQAVGTKSTQGKLPTIDKDQVDDLQVLLSKGTSKEAIALADHLKAHPTEAGHFGPRTYAALAKETGLSEADIKKLDFNKKEDWAKVSGHKAPEVTANAVASPTDVIDAASDKVKDFVAKASALLNGDGTIKDLEGKLKASKELDAATKDKILVNGKIETAELVVAANLINDKESDLNGFKRMLANPDQQKQIVALDETKEALDKLLQDVGIKKIDGVYADTKSVKADDLGIANGGKKTKTTDNGLGTN